MNTKACKQHNNTKVIIYKKFLLSKILAISRTYNIFLK